MKEPGQRLSKRRVLISSWHLVVDTPLGDPGPWALTHRWTLGGSLWKAGSSAEFSQLWKKNKHFVVGNYAFDKFLEHGDTSEIDDLAEMLLAA